MTLIKVPGKKKRQHKMNHLDSDYFVTCSKTGDQFAGRHILADFWNVERMGDLDFIKETIEESCLMEEST